jgi:hypothetical protein
MNPVWIRIPDIGGFTDVVVVEVHVAPGDEVAENDPLITRRPTRRRWTSPRRWPARSPRWW